MTEQSTLLAILRGVVRGALEGGVDTTVIRTVLGQVYTESFEKSRIYDGITLACSGTSHGLCAGCLCECHVVVL